ncbi:MAG: N4-gp56 family major capsid protein, partial [Actinobacteria bacterium]|nr:N4-gp56 family major capsid protein [Actinomycetota bacterium]
YDLLIRYPLRSQLYFDRVADVMPTNQSMNGSSVIFNLATELATAITPLTETSDIDAVAMANSQITVTLVEYGNAMNVTAKLRGTSMVDVMPAVANLLGYNAGRSMDIVVFNILVAGTNVIYGGAVVSRVTVAAGTTITSAKIRQVLASLKEANVADFGGYYNAFIHPRVSYDLRSETGAAAWRDPHVYSQPSEIWNGEIGAYEGFRFIESPNVSPFVDAGVGGTVDVYPTLFMGREALAKAYSTADGGGPQPRVVASPVIDKLRRFTPMGWYWLGGFSRFREAALYRLETSSSIGANT